MGKVSGKKTERDEEAAKIGRDVKRRLDPAAEAVKVADTAFGPRTSAFPTFMAGPWELKADEKINRAFRGVWRGMDELFSTALMREMVKGIVEGEPPTPEQHKHLCDLIDLASTARMSTHFSGFATEGRKMQHPANREKAIFADPYETASLHSEMDTARREYVQRKMAAVKKKGGDAEDIIKAGVRAAIEFTLNYFTAPITAENVFKYSRRGAGGNSIFSKDDQLQLAEREKLKRLYESIGGTLRKGTEEDPLQSQKQAWGENLSSIDGSGGFADAPPSPRRRPSLPPAELAFYGLEP
jgi:hypothetical protein